jgi:ArsR family transcriptional regulator
MTNQPAEACDARAAAEFLRALAHPMRLRILCRLLQGELPVHGFEQELGLRQPSLSQQLAQLREAGLVATRREAKSIVYRLADPRVETVLEALHATFRISLERRGRAPEPGASPATPGDASRPAMPPAARIGRMTPVATLASAGAPDPRAAAGCGVFAVVGRPASVHGGEAVHD